MPWWQGVGALLPPSKSVGGGSSVRVGRLIRLVGVRVSWPRRSVGRRRLWSESRAAAARICCVVPVPQSCSSPRHHWGWKDIRRRFVTATGRWEGRGSPSAATPPSAFPASEVHLSQVELAEAGGEWCSRRHCSPQCGTQTASMHSVRSRSATGSACVPSCRSGEFRISLPVYQGTGSLGRRAPTCRDGSAAVQWSRSAVGNEFDGTWSGRWGCHTWGMVACDSAVGNVWFTPGSLLDSDFSLR